MLNWADRFNICSFLDNHHYSSTHQSVECLVAVGMIRSFTLTAGNWQELSLFLRQNDDWIFGHINYDIKNSIEPLQSNHPDPIGFPDLFFFVPETVLQLGSGELMIATCHEDPAEIFKAIVQSPVQAEKKATDASIRSRISRAHYIRTVQAIQQHILRGDCYELNFCQEFYADNASIHALSVYSELTRISPNPFSCFYKLNDKYVLCASPERYLQKKGNAILSQPIKGTFKRNLADSVADEALKDELRSSEKDKSENVMVVDLVRNDLSRVCKEGTVRVDELFGIYSFPQVHQMISTISGELKDGLDMAAIIQATFPMGSMTGAPKRKVMELIERYETTKRGIYSGAVGYISPGGDFDFNVVIRSILYNAGSQYLSYLVGGGITFYSDPEKEYEECLLKAEAIRRVLEGLG